MKEKQSKEKQKKTTKGHQGHQVSEKSFRLSAKNLFLTYPEKQEGTTALSREIIINHLLAFFKNRTVIKLIVSKEKGKENDYDHFHAFVTLDKRCNIKSENSLDINGIHGNYQTAKNKKKAIDYVTKEDTNLLSIGYNPVFEKASDYKTPFEAFCHICFFDNIDPRYLIATAQKGQFREELFPILVDYYKNPKPYKRFIETHFPPEAKKLASMTIREDIKERIVNWLMQQRSSLGQINGIPYFYGASNLGKSALVRKLFSSITGERGVLVVRNFNQTKKFDPSIHRTIIFDDVSLNRLCPEEIIALLTSDDSKTIDVKYSITEIPKTIITVFIGNQPPELYFGRPGTTSIKHQEAILRRIYPIEISENFNFSSKVMKGMVKKGTMAPIVWNSKQVHHNDPNRNLLHRTELLEGLIGVIGSTLILYDQGNRGVTKEQLKKFFHDSMTKLGYSGYNDEKI